MWTIFPFVLLFAIPHFMWNNWRRGLPIWTRRDNELIVRVYGEIVEEKTA